MTNTNRSKRKRRMAREPKLGAAAPQKNRAVEGNAAQETARAAAPKQPNKTEKVLSNLKRPEGATLDELVELTGWLPHTARAALTGLRKKGHAVQRTKIDGVSRYSVAEPAS